jgi:hypothetical protein
MAAGGGVALQDVKKRVVEHLLAQAQAPGDMQAACFKAIGDLGAVPSSHSFHHLSHAAGQASRCTSKTPFTRLQSGRSRIAAICPQGMEMFKELAAARSTHLRTQTDFPCHMHQSSPLTF